MHNRLNGFEFDPLGVEEVESWEVWAELHHVEKMRHFGPFSSLEGAEECALILSARSDVISVFVEEVKVDEVN